MTLNIHQIFTEECNKMVLGKSKVLAGIIKKQGLVKPWVLLKWGSTKFCNSVFKDVGYNL